MASRAELRPGGDARHHWAWMYLERIALIVQDYDEAIRFFVDVLGPPQVAP
jgi:hypothetical protein